ncbi:Hypothetical predicted protein, partial [Pelobates cultripes]
MGRTRKSEPPKTPRGPQLSQSQGPMDDYLHNTADASGEASGSKMAPTSSAPGAPSASTLEGIGEELRTIAASMATKADLLGLTTTIQDALRAEIAGIRTEVTLLLQLRRSVEDLDNRGRRCNIRGIRDVHGSPAEPQLTETRHTTNSSDQAPGGETPPHVQTYIQDTIRARVDPNAASFLDEPLTTEDLAAALKHTKYGRAPGPDGFPSGYYKQFAMTLLPWLTRAVNEVSEGGHFGTESLTATIAVLLKPGKDPEHCCSYRPISLLNVDTKLLTKVLATRLQRILPSLVHVDQTGFIPGREARDSTLRLFSIQHHARKHRKHLLLLSTDAEKAFDRVNWAYMFQTLRSMGFGQRIMAWITVLYSTPRAAVRVNGAIRDNRNVHGYTWQGTEHKVAAYADDLLFFVSQPRITLPCILSEIERFGRLSGFRLNLAKCEALNITTPAAEYEALGLLFPFRWCTEAMKYLGIWITTDPQEIYRRNFETLLRNIETDLTRWSYPHITWHGHIAVLKMNILPRILYLFQTIPTTLPESFFSTLKSA